ncbi:MAG: hypothetical protein OEZ58_19655, partial [Gammaproteobacteria bacterium]|nr:hypothetical protein [Gammaproteobacteria bacterium]
ACIANSSHSTLARQIGWLQVIFSLDDGYDFSTKHSIDEVVGLLVADTLKSDSMLWLKPPYGN